ncbi:MAG: rod shape-determining protein MreC [bacterium]
MTYLQTDRNKKNIIRKDYFFAIIFGILLITFGNLFSERLVGGVIWVKNLLHINGTPPAELDQNQSPEYLNAKITALQSENDSLKSFLNANDDVNTKRPQGSLFAVSEKPPFSPYDSITIRGGSQNGIQVDDIVFAGPDVIVGYVSKVLDTTSIVTLYSSSGEHQEVYVGTSSDTVVSEGRGGGNFYIKVPSETKVAVGDPIVWPSMQNILLGKVDKVDAAPGDAFSYILFKSLIPISSIRYVQVVPNNF